MSFLTFSKLNKIYPNGFHAVKDFELVVEQGEFIVFVGPSGCGKTTTLRMLAGLEDISSGEIFIKEKLVNDLEPKDRGIAMVFQNYALYPHMTVKDNMTYGLKFKKVPKEEIESRVLETAKILDFDEDYLKRKPQQLSGGQKQRVALGRAIIRRPNVFLMDEPLSNLDAKLRIQMRNEITKIHEQVNATTIYVTHDQVEAMTMADRIVVMNEGYVQQIDTPENIYNYPNNTFVAGFIGAPAMNFLNGTYKNGSVVLQNDKVINIPKQHHMYYEDYEGKEVVFGIRPENCDIVGEINKDESGLLGKADYVELLGYESIVYFKDEVNNVISKIDAKRKITTNNTIFVKFDMDMYWLFDSTTKNRIRRDV